MGRADLWELVRRAALTSSPQHTHQEAPLGKLDQFVKEVFLDSTPKITHDALRFVVPEETRTTELFADGVLYRANTTELFSLPLPWSLATAEEIVLEFKMQGDKLGYFEVERALLRRQARQCLRAKEFPQNQERIPLWLIVSHLPEWLPKTTRVLRTVEPGCYLLEPAFEEVWVIAANELPLLPELVPFLVTRAGLPLVEFARWLIRQNYQLASDLIEVVPMSDAQYEELLAELETYTEKEHKARKRRFVRRLAEQEGLVEEFLEEGKEEGKTEALLETLELRLGRTLTDQESARLQEKYKALGSRRLTQTLLSLDKDALVPWLLSPEAK